MARPYVVASSAGPNVHPRAIWACLTLLASVLLLGCVSTPAFRDGAGEVLPHSTAELATLHVNGTKQTVLIRGRDARGPILVVLHGGPGASETAFFRRFNAALEDRLTVAYWDQRGAGKSYDASIPPETMTVARFIADLDVVVDELRRRFRQEQVVLLGHSWGSALAVLYAQRHPEKVLALIGTGQVASYPAAEAASYAFALREAERRHHAESLSQLRRIGPPPHDVDRMLVSRRWVERFGGSFHAEPNYIDLVAGALTMPENTIVDLVRFWRGNQFSLRAMWPELRDLDLTRAAPCIAAPVTFLLGRHDWQVPSVVAADYFLGLDAPSKTLVWFERSAHNVPFEEPHRFNREVIAAVERARRMGARAGFTCSPRTADAPPHVGR